MKDIDMQQSEQALLKFIEKEEVHLKFIKDIDDQQCEEALLKPAEEKSEEEEAHLKFIEEKNMHLKMWEDETTLYETMKSKNESSRWRFLFIHYGPKYITLAVNLNIKTSSIVGILPENDPVKSIAEALKILVLNYNIGAIVYGNYVDFTLSHCFYYNKKCVKLVQYLSGEPEFQDMKYTCWVGTCAYMYVGFPRYYQPFEQPVEEESEKLIALGVLLSYFNSMGKYKCMVHGFLTQRG